MTVKSYNLFMLLATILAWLGFFIVISSFDPQSADLTVFGLFYGILLLSLLGTFSLLGFCFRAFWNKKRGVPRFMAMESFRQALIFSVVVLVALGLQSMRVLTWWNIMLLVFVATFLEFVILLFRGNQNKDLK
ncbi:MAG: hypothetical protein Q8O32_02910 [bacterium]|nr:hypothetical protein [bacterium]